MLGLYQPTEGAILLDGVDIRQLDPADLRRNVAYVSQDVSLLFGSLRYNVTLARPHADDASISHAAGLAGLMDMVSRHPKGFDLQVGERGELLSGGQRQAVGLARAFLQDAPVLVLDEPTSAMDMASEAAVAASLSRDCAGRTLILSTHRLHLLTLVDRVIVVDRGRIVADGPRDQIAQGLAGAAGAPAAQGRSPVRAQAVPPAVPTQSFGVNVKRV
jgi:ATP-binding cassette subfamily C protein LapB